jgi:type IX secretion system PorP/SprF family membrane protein
MKKIILSLFALATVFQAFAQDFHFSQFYASPLNLNPALTGAFNGKYRVAMIYRDQWSGVSESSFQTYSGAIDLRFNVNEKKVMKDVASVGMVFNSDKAAIFGYNANSIQLSSAYTKCLNVENTQFLTAAIQAGLGQRNINYDNLDFPNEFNGINGFNLNTNEKFPNNNFAYPDLSTGLNYTYSPKRNTTIFLGGAIHHLFSPNISFFSEENGGNQVLLRKYSIHASAQLPLGFKNSYSPRLYFASQGGHAQMNLGTNFRFQFSDYGSTALHTGGWIRGVRSNSTLGVDAAAIMVGYELNNFLLGISYDINLRGLSVYNRNQGAFEISLGYLGDYDNDTILCPKF